MSAQNSGSDDEPEQGASPPHTMRSVPDFTRLQDLPEHLRPPRCTLQWQAAELPEAVLALALSPKEKIVAVATVEDEIQCLEVGKGEVRWTLSGHDGGVNSLAFLGGNSLVSAGEDGRVRTWNIARAACTQELVVDAEGADRGPSGYSVSHVAATADGSRYACAAGSMITLFTAGSGGASAAPTKRLMPPLPGTVESLRFDRHGNLLASYYGGITYWDLSRQEEEGQALDLTYPANCLATDVSPDRTWLVAGAHDQSVHIFHLVAGTREEGVRVEEMTCGGYDSKVTAVNFSRDGRWLASSGGDKCMVWDFKDSPAGSIPIATVGHQAPVTCLAWQPDGSLLATGGKDGLVLLFEMEHALDGRPKVCLPGAIAVDAVGDEVTALRWASDGVFYTGHISGHVRKWELPLSAD